MSTFTYFSIFFFHLNSHLSPFPLFTLTLPPQTHYSPHPHRTHSILSFSTAKNDSSILLLFLASDPLPLYQSSPCQLLSNLSTLCPTTPSNPIFLIPYPTLALSLRTTPGLGHLCYSLFPLTIPLPQTPEVFCTLYFVHHSSIFPPFLNLYSTFLDPLNPTLN